MTPHYEVWVSDDPSSGRGVIRLDMGDVNAAYEILNLQDDDVTTTVKFLLGCYLQRNAVDHSQTMRVRAGNVTMYNDNAVKEVGMKGGYCFCRVGGTPVWTSVLQIRGPW